MAYTAFKVRVQLSLVQLFCTINLLVVQERAQLHHRKLHSFVKWEDYPFVKPTSMVGAAVLI